MQLVDHGNQRLLPFRSALQQEKHVVNPDGIVQPATVVHRVRLRARVPPQGNPGFFVNAGSNEGTDDRILSNAAPGKHH